MDNNSSELRRAFDKVKKERDDLRKEVAHLRETNINLTRSLVRSINEKGVTYAEVP